MANFVVRGIEDERYQRFRARLVEQGLTLGEWLSDRMDAELDEKTEGTGGNHGNDGERKTKALP